MKTRLSGQKNDGPPSKKAKHEHHAGMDITSLYKDVFTQVIPNALGTLDAVEVISRLSQTNKHFCSFFKDPSVDEVLLRGLYQAVIDGNYQWVSRILEVRPALLLMKCPQDLIIQSQLTWQIFCINEDVLTVAVLRKQFEMIKLLGFYYDKLEQTEDLKEARKNALSKWTPYVMTLNAAGVNRIVIPEEYVNLIQACIDVCKEEIIADGKLGEKSKAAIDLFCNRLLSAETPIKLNDYVDVELLLLAAYQLFEDGSYNTKTKLQRFSAQTVGLIQSVISPETATILCEGLDIVAQTMQAGEIPQISDLALSLKLRDGDSFYRIAANLISGLGYTFLCGVDGKKANWGCYVERYTSYRFEKVMSDKNEKFLEYYAAQVDTFEPSMPRSRT